ncbi:MAG: hypothetical protein Q8Q35_00990 [Nanoarchaeota archaeon]|nr:hypothetical protein [Nanoarchaeota archaeon]
MKLENIIGLALLTGCTGQDIIVTNNYNMNLFAELGDLPLNVDQDLICAVEFYSGKTLTSTPLEGNYNYTWTINERVVFRESGNISTLDSYHIRRGDQVSCIPSIKGVSYKIEPVSRLID